MAALAVVVVTLGVSAPLTPNEARAADAEEIRIAWSVRLDEAPLVEDQLDYEGEVRIKPPSETRGAPCGAASCRPRVPALLRALG